MRYPSHTSYVTPVYDCRIAPGSSPTHRPVKTPQPLQPYRTPRHTQPSLSVWKRAQTPTVDTHGHRLGAKIRESARRAARPRRAAWFARTVVHACQISQRAVPMVWGLRRAGFTSREHRLSEACDRQIASVVDAATPEEAGRAAYACVATRSSSLPLPAQRNASGSLGPLFTMCAA